MEQYPIKKLRDTNLKITLPIIALLTSLAPVGVILISFVVLSFLAISSFIIPIFCEKHGLVKNKQSILKVIGISLFCALPWLLILLTSTLFKDSYHIRGGAIIFIIIFGFSWLKDSIVTIYNLPSESTLNTNRHSPYWLLILMSLSIIWLAPYMMVPVATEQFVTLNEGIRQATEAQNAVSQFYLDNGYFPTSNEDISLGYPSNIYRKVVKSITIKPNGIIIITYNENMHDNAELHLQAKIVKNKITWECIMAKDISAIDYLPKDCRLKLQKLMLKDSK
jgi:hypothetical protein